MKDIGRRLKARREELGLSIEQAQAETKIRRRYLEALEAGKDDVIPGEVYVKGFLRFYANFLGLDGLALVKEYGEWKESQAALAEAALVTRAARRKGPEALKGPAATPPGETAAATQTGAAAPRAGDQSEPAPAAPVSRPAPASRSAVRAATPLRAARGRGSGRFGHILLSTLVVLALVAAAGLWYVWNNAAPAAGSDTGARPGDDQPDGDTGDAGGEGTGGSAATQPHWSLAGESASEARYVVYGAPFTVGVEVTSERCWIQVFADGKTVFEGTLEPGAREQWTSQTRLSIRFGRPQLVRLTVDGQSLGLAGTKDEPRDVFFEAGSPPAGGTATGGA